jgi:hypothetical protein
LALIEISGRLKQIKGQISLQTRVKVAEAVAAQAVPLQATGPKPPNMQKINFDTETDAEEASKPKTSWVRRYVSGFASISKSIVVLLTYFSF